MHIIPALAITTAVAFTSNLPLGFWRAGQRKFSWRWFLAVHLSIPLVIFVRISLGISLWYVWIGIAAAIGGQILGGLARKRWRSNSLSAG